MHLRKLLVKNANKSYGNSYEQATSNPVGFCTCCGPLFHRFCIYGDDISGIGCGCRDGFLGALLQTELIDTRELTDPAFCASLFRYLAFPIFFYPSCRQKKQYGGDDIEAGTCQYGIAQIVELHCCPGLVSELPLR